MRADVNQLTICGIVLPEPVQENDEWIFTQSIRDEVYAILFQDLVKNHRLIHLEYTIHCAKLAHDLQSGRLILAHQVKVMMLAELLERVYRDYLNVPREVVSLRREMAGYQNLLQARYTFLANSFQPVSSSSSLSQSIRSHTVLANFPRLLITRMRRLLVTAGFVLTGGDGYWRFINAIDGVFAPVLQQVNLLFYFPRLLTNLALLGKHLIPVEYWMSFSERELGWKIRLRGQMERRWFELGNDIVWVTAAILTSFVFVGLLAPFGFYVGCVSQALDIVLAGFRVYLEMHRLRQLEAKYVDQQALLEVGSDDYAQTHDFLMYLQERKTFEQKRFCLQLASPGILLIAIILSLPMVALNPIIPVIGALIAVAITIGIFVTNRQLEEQWRMQQQAPLRPVPQVASVNAAVCPSKMSRMSLFGFFKTSAAMEELQSDPSSLTLIRNAHPKKQ